MWIKDHYYNNADKLAPWNLSGEVFCICLNNGDKVIKSSGMLEPSLGCRRRAQGCEGATTATWTERGNRADTGSKRDHFFFPDSLVKGEKRFFAFHKTEDPLLQWELTFYKVKISAHFYEWSRFMAVALFCMK